MVSLPARPWTVTLSGRAPRHSMVSSSPGVPLRVEPVLTLVETPLTVQRVTACEGVARAVVQFAVWRARV